MVKTKGPMLSLGAQGALANALVASSWRGRTYFKKLSTPHNPKTPDQSAIRAALRGLSKTWPNISTARQSSWNPLAEERRISPIAIYNKTNLERWRKFQGLTERYPATEGVGIATLGGWTATARLRTIAVHGIKFTPPGSAWVYCFSSTDPAFDSQWNNLIWLAQVKGTTTAFDFVYGPLQPGTYYFRLRGGSYTGALGAQQATFNATLP